MRLLRSGTFFKGLLLFLGKSFSSSIARPIFVFIFGLFLFGSGLSETIDRIMAVVQEDVITFTDLRITEAFILYDEERIDPAKDLRSQILEVLINKKLVALMTSEDVLVEEAEIDKELRRLIGEQGDQRIQANLVKFGLSAGDLRKLIQEDLFYRKALSSRFNQTIIVSLREIEQYYNQRYMPFLEEKGKNVRPMMEILDQLEIAVKEEKIESQIATWLNNLRREAYIEIKTDDGVRA